jgi:hypothetical protein
MPDYSYLTRKQKWYDKLQTDEFANMMENQKMPEYTPDLSMRALKLGQGATAGMADPYMEKSLGGQFGADPELMGLTKKIYDETNNLNEAGANYNTQNVDIGRGIQNKSNIFNDYLAKLGYGNALSRDQQSRLSNLGIQNISRESNDVINNMQIAAKKKLLEENSAKLRKKNENSGWINAIAAVGAIIGTIYGGGPATGAAVYGGIKSGGEALVNKD